MNTLNKYLSTKVNKVSHIELPDSPNFYDYMKYFEENNFKEVAYSEFGTIFNQFNIYCSQFKKPLFMMRNDSKTIKGYFDNGSNDNEWVRFCYPGKINEKNPIFFVRVTSDGREVNPQRFVIGCIQYNDVIWDRININDYEEFKKTVEKYTYTK